MWEPSPVLYKARLDVKWNKERGDLRGGPNPTKLPTWEKQSLFTKISHQQAKACAAGSSPSTQQNVVAPYIVFGGDDSSSLFLYKKLAFMFYILPRGY